MAATGQGEHEAKSTAGAYGKPLPEITALNRAFWDYARQCRLALQFCNACGDAHFPESPVCPNCLGAEQSWKPVSGRGTLEAWADFHRPYWEGFKKDLPYRVCVVRLEEGQAIFFICPACGRLQRPRLIKDNQFFLVNLSDEQMKTLQFLYDSNL